ncbi:MAG: hypothetical protein JNJ77_15325 [Planctomycetia bacterium]|nr:hypothetical protein [Planctomycetia bacterium]
MNRLSLICLLLAGLVAQVQAQSTIEVKIDPSLVKAIPESGRVLVILQKEGQAPSGRQRGGEPRFGIGATSKFSSPYFGVDVDQFIADKIAVIDDSSTAFPVNKLSEVPAGTYSAQAVFHTNRDIALPTAFGNLISKPTTIQWNPKAKQAHQLMLSDRLPDERMPSDTATVKYLKFPSKLLSDFHKRPMYYRLSVILPANFDKEPEKQYLLCVHIGGFGSRYTGGSRIRPDPRFVQIMLDGAGPFGDPYQVNSENNGPYGDALTQEVIPHIEKTFRCGGTGKRFTTGASTGGWVSLALQLYYPDYFNGCWSSCPDSVDFRDYELINIYEDTNAYVNKFGFERPSQRTVNGDTVMTVRHETQVENVIGRGGSFATGGKDWCSWNAVYGPRGADGLPKPLWNARTGEIDKSVVETWKKHDLRLYLESKWESIGSRLNGKIHVWVGDADDYFLNNAVHRFKSTADHLDNPKFNGEIIIAPRRNHTVGWTSQQILDAMAKRAEETR